ncbi:hypothetical protein COJ08_26105 [Bacillus cereus]|nr:hypothetical protein COJ08_26105 [Bacillus cereus]
MFLAGGDFFEWGSQKNTTQRCPKRSVSAVEQFAWVLRIAERFPMIASLGCQAKKWKGCEAGLLLFFLNDFQIFSSSKLILEKRSGHAVKRQAGTQLLFLPCRPFLAYKSGLARGVGGERCYQPVSQRFLLTYRLFMSPNAF